MGETWRLQSCPKGVPNGSDPVRRFAAVRPGASRFLIPCRPSMTIAGKRRSRRVVHGSASFNPGAQPGRSARHRSPGPSDRQPRERRAGRGFAFSPRQSQENGLHGRGGAGPFRRVGDAGHGSGPSERDRETRPRPCRVAGVFRRPDGPHRRGLRICLRRPGRPVGERGPARRAPGGPRFAPLRGGGRHSRGHGHGGRRPAPGVRRGPEGPRLDLDRRRRLRDGRDRGADGRLGHRCHSHRRPKVFRRPARPGR